ncbi:MAG: complex I subunit 5 family protein [Rubrobacteraceae bacterium]
MIAISLAIGITWIFGAALAMLDGRRTGVGIIALAAMGASFASVAVLAIQVFREGTVVFVAGNWPLGLGIALRADALGVTFAAVSCGVVLVSLLYEIILGVRSRTFPALVLFLNTGLVGIFLTGDMFNFYVFFEIAMTSAYVLTGYREEDVQVRAAFIFAVVNLLGSVIFLIAVAALYHITGTLDMRIAAERVVETGANPTVIIATAIFVAFGLKIGLFPFHFWLPAVYVGSHAPVAAILSGALANIGSYGLLRFGGFILPDQLAFGTPVLLALGAASIIYGAHQAVARRSPVEVMAYSAIGQAGYILIGIAIGGPVGYAAAVIYAVVNSLNKLLIFLATGLRGWMVGAAFAVGAFSIAGVPPAAGFVSKLALFRAAVGWDGLVGAVALVFLIFLGGAISFVYSFQIYQSIYLKPGLMEQGKPSPLAARVLVVALAALLICLGFYPEPLLYVGQQAAAVLAGGV